MMAVVPLLALSVHRRPWAMDIWNWGAGGSQSAPLGLGGLGGNVLALAKEEYEPRSHHL